MRPSIYDILVFLLLLSSCGGARRQYQLDVQSAALVNESTLALVNSSTTEDLECLQMSFVVSGISDGQEAFIPFFSEGNLNIDPLIVKLSQGEQIGIKDLVEAWSSPASVTIDSSIKDLKLLVSGFYALCYKGKPVNILFSGETDFVEDDLNGESLEVNLTSSTLMPVNAIPAHVEKAATFDEEGDNFTYVALAHQKDKFNASPFACMDLKAPGETPNKVTVKPYFITLNTDGSYSASSDFMFNDSYSSYFRHDFNFIEKNENQFNDLFRSMMLFPVFTGVEYDIVYTQGTGDQCTKDDTLSSTLRVTKKDKEECPYSNGKILVCSVDWDDVSTTQDHVCECVTRPSL